MFRSRTACLVSIVSCLGAAASAQQAFEVSEDGHRSASVLDHADRGAVARGTGVPFPLVPDQSVMLRRQIGGLQIADMDGDGNNDLVAVCYISNSFPPYEDWHDMIFFGNGNGIHTAPGWISDVETHTGDVQVGDVDEDGINDIVTIHGGLRSDTVRAYYGTGTGVSTAPGYTANIAGNAWGTAGVLADMDNDGDLDLVTTNQGVAPNAFRPMMMFRNDLGDLTQSAVWQSDEQSIQNGVAARDITGDGFPDLAVAKWINFQSGVYYNTSGTPDTFQSVFVPTTGADRGAAFTDLENDGVIELGFGGDPSRVYQSAHGALFEIYASDPPFAGPQDFRFFDVDGDGDDDLAEIMFSDGRAHIYLNREGVLDTQPTWTFDASEVGTALAFGDLNGDGRDDLALGYAGNTCVRVFFAQAASCPADLVEPFGVLNFFDVSAFITAFNAADPAADLAEPFGTLNFFDVSAYIAAYNAGCP
ncbi:MAG: FG-GAP-like repeat-containing protein [Phycisphaerales bacterium]